MADFYGTLIIGPSGSGKSTLTAGLQQFLTAIERKNIVISLDPANEDSKYKVASFSNQKLDF